MSLYAVQRPRRVRQVVADVLVIVWIGFWAWQGWSTWSSIHSLTEPTQKTHDSALGMAENLDRAGEVLGAVPLLGDAAAEPFRKAAEQATKLATGASDSEEAITTLAWKAGLSLGLVPTVLLLAFYLPPRRRFVRDSGQARAYLEAGGSPDLLALRALGSHELASLTEVAPDPSGAWRRGDAAVIRKLAEMELRRCGVEPPGPAATGGSPVSGAPVD